MPYSFEERRNAAALELGVPINKVPKGLAIIMDGNGRWATRQGLPRFEGHRQGGKQVEKIVLECCRLGVESLSLYSFSMQNWKRPQMEVDFLMYIITRYLVGIRDMLMDNEVKLVHLGSTNGLPEEMVEELHKTIEITSKNKGLVLGLALNYGGREEILEATKSIAQKFKAGEISIEDIDEDCFAQNLYTADMVDPDLVIRTSEELRISNFLLWQISYAELFPTSTLWPDFGVENLQEAIKGFAERERRKGDVKESDEG